MIICPRVRYRFTKRSRWLPRDMTRLFLVRDCFQLECWYRPGLGIWPWRSRDARWPEARPVVYPYPAVGVDVKKRKPKDGAASQAETLASVVTKLFEKLPNIVQHMAVVRYDDGEARQAGRIIVETLGASWKVILKDKDTKCEINCVGNTLDDALVLADLYAGSDDAPWEPDVWALGKGPKKGR